MRRTRSASGTLVLYDAAMRRRARNSATTWPGLREAAAGPDFVLAMEASRRPQPLLTHPKRDNVGEWHIHWPAEGRHCYRFEAQLRILRGLVPDQGHLPMQRLRFLVKRPLPDGRHKAIDSFVVHICRLYPLRAGVVAQAGKSEIGPPPGKTCESWRHCALKAALFSLLAGASPLASTAATKSERMLAKRLRVIPTAIGLIPPSPFLMVFIASGMAAGVLPSRRATRFTADRRSRRRISERPEWLSKVANRVARVGDSGALPGSLLRFVVLVIRYCSFRETIEMSAVVSG
jgi:hypothetical protein